MCADAAHIQLPTLQQVCRFISKLLAVTQRVSLLLFLGMSIISSHFPPGPAKGKAFAILGAGQPIGFIIGMILGGILSESSASWRTIFWLQAGLGSLLCVLGWFVLLMDEHSNRYTQGLDWVGAVLSTAGLGLLVCDLA